jgi:hypothetical protein
LRGPAGVIPQRALGKSQQDAIAGRGFAELQQGLRVDECPVRHVLQLGELELLAVPGDHGRPRDFECVRGFLAQNVPRAAELFRLQAEKASGSVDAAAREQVRQETEVRRWPHAVGQRP